MTSISERALATAKPPKEPEGTEGRVCKECGQKLPTRRNRERHNLLFAILGPAHAHWPEDAPFQATDLEDLRAKLLIEVGWCETEEMKFAGTSKKQMMASLAAWMSMPRKKPLRKFEETFSGMKGYAPKSIAWTPRCTEQQFKKILTAVIEVVENVTGTTIEQLKREHANEI